MASMSRCKNSFCPRLWDNTYFAGRYMKTLHDDATQKMVDSLASRYVDNNTTVLLSTGSTMAMLARAIYKRVSEDSLKGLSVIAQNVEVALEGLRQKLPSVELYMPAGPIMNDVAAVEVHRLPARLNVARIFMSFGGFSCDGGLTDATQDAARTKRSILPWPFIGKPLPDFFFVIQDWKLGLVQDQRTLTRRVFTNMREKHTIRIALNKPTGDAAAFETEVSEIQKKWSLKTECELDDKKVLILSS